MKISKDSLGKAYLILADFIIPIPLTILMFYLWKDKTGSTTYSYFILLLGIVYGYIVPGVLSNLFKLWKFTWPFQVKNVFYHHGFIYSSYFALILYLSFSEKIELTTLNSIRIVLANFAVFGILVSHHEIMAIRFGMIKNFNSVAAKGKSPVEVVTDFAFFSFALVGASFAYSSIYAYKQIIIEYKTSPAEMVYCFVICFLIMILSSTPYFIKERKQIKKNRELIKAGILKY